MQNLNLRLEQTGPTLSVYEGKALELKAPEKISITGDIKSVSSFLDIRKALGTGNQAIDLSRAIIIVDKKALTLELLVDPESHYGTKVLGKLEKSDDLEPFQINRNATFTKEQLVKLLKFNRIYFADKDKHAAMLLAFQKVSSTVNIKANESSDDRGNKERAFVKEVTSNAPTEFILDIPIFKGFPSSRFRVEVCLDVTEGSARFWFESTELHELMQNQVEKIFEDELASAEGFVIINK